mgnify:CR=1 FL=1
MILGGAMFSYDKLNYMIGGGMDKNVPLIADFMPARWGYEGLVVETYISNEYGEKFYEIERKESICTYKQSYYLPLLKELLYESKGALNNSTGLNQGKAIINLSILKHEIIKENRINPTVIFENTEKIEAKNLNTRLVDEIEEYLKEVNNFYSTIYNSVVIRKEMLKTELSKENGNGLRTLKEQYYNSNLNEILTNSLLKKRIFINSEFNVMQKMDPIYLNPSRGNYLDVRTHFYAPKKYFFGTLISTFWFNTITLWAYTVLLFIILYFNVLKKILSIPNPFKLLKNLKK